MKTNIFLNLILISFLSCKNDNGKKNENINEPIIFSEPRWSDSISEKIYIATNKGDTTAYLQVYYDCWRKMRTDEILPVSFIMANKYGYRDAYFHVYLSLSGQNRTGSTGIESMDNSSKCLAMYYLLKATEKGYLDAYYETEEIFKGKRIPNSSFYLLKLAEETK